MNPSRIIAACLAATVAATAAPVSKLAAEWLVPSASTSKQFSLVDAATGTVRTCTMNADGSIRWRPPVATGVNGVTDASGGFTAATAGEAIAVTSSMSNRVMLVDVDAASPTARAMPSLAGVGPCGVTATVAAGTTECMIVSTLNGGTSFGRAEAHANPVSSASLEGYTSHAVDFRRLQPLADPLAPANRVAFYSATSGGNTATGLLIRSGGLVNRHAKTTYGGVFEFIPGVLDVNGGAGLPLILGYRAGSSSAWLIKVATPLTSAVFASTAATLPFAVSGIIPILDGGVGPLTDGFIAIAADGSEARWIRIDKAGTGLLATAETFAPTKGTALAGLIPVPGIGVIKLEGRSATGPSTGFKGLLWNGTEWRKADNGELPPIPAPGQSVASLLFYDRDPAVDESAILLGIQAVPDWTRPLVYPDPLPVSVNRESFLSSAAGLTFSSTHPVSPPYGTNHVLTNQVEPGLSVTALGSAAALFAPDLLIEPASGHFTESFQVTAAYDEERQNLYWRDENGGSWRAWTGPLAVGYNRSLLFTLQSMSTGVLGTIERRSYTFAAAELADQDTDHDGVPDYVELHYGLDPFGGADGDGDGWSDLDELLKGTNPNAAGDYPAEGNTADVAVHGGFRIAAVARTHTGAEIRNGEEMLAHGQDGALLDRQAVGSFGVTLPDGGTRGALLASDTPVPANELVALSTPLYFDITTGSRSGREVRAFVPSPPPVAFHPAFVPTGTNLAADAAGWVAAAQSAAAALPLAAARTIIEPVDTAVAVLLEELVHNALVTANLPAATPVLEEFTVFADRDTDRLRSGLSTSDHARLRAVGFDFRLALGVAATARAGMTTAANNIYLGHATVSSSTPGMLMPLDAIRLMFRGGDAPDGYVGAVTVANLTTARNAYQAAIGNAAQAFRPIATWTVEIIQDPPSRGVYQRVPDAVPVVLLDAAGERFLLEQGLGLQPGTRFAITGFTDTPDNGGYDTIEATRVLLSFLPVASDNDTDGNLLDDEWERFFFGAIGQDPFSHPGASAHPLLQYFLDGLDPRGGEVPAAAPVALAPQEPVIADGTGGSFNLDFSFPAAYQDRFDFILEKSTSLAGGSFGEIPGVAATPLGGDRFRMVVPASAALTPTGFYRVRIRLR